MRLIATSIFAAICGANAWAGHPVMDIWNCAARKIGICYSQGYHQCKECQGPAMYSPHAMSSVPVQQGPTFVSEPMVHAPAPAYMYPGHQGIPKQYNEPLEPAGPHAAEQPTLAVPEIDEQPSISPMLQPPVSAPTIPHIPSVSEEPASPSDIKTEIQVPNVTPPQVSVPTPVKPEPEVVPRPTVPMPTPHLEPQLPLVQPPAKAPENLPPGNLNDDDLLVPPDTGLLDSVGYPPQRSPYSRYRYAPYSAPRGNAYQPGDPATRYRTAQLQQRTIVEPR